jgi:hypothetical protein
VESVYSAVRTESLYKTDKLRLWRVNVSRSKVAGAWCWSLASTCPYMTSWRGQDLLPIPPPSGAAAPSGPGPPHCRGFTITDTPQSAGLLCTRDRPVTQNSTFTTHDTYKIQTSMPPPGFEPAILASEWPQNNALDRAATGIGLRFAVPVTNASGGIWLLHSLTPPQ